MLDTYARSKIEPVFDKGADFFLMLNMEPSHITACALFTGISAAALYYYGYIAPSVAALWFSGYLDAVDGNMARKLKKVSKTGALCDIVFDRIVELSIIIAIALRHENSSFCMLILCSSIVLSMTVFLTTGALASNPDKKGKKSFRYQAGLMERTEGFIMSTAMMILGEFVISFGYLYAALILFTAVQRFFEARRLLSED